MALQAPPSDAPSASTRPYLIRALHDWCTDNGFTPYLAVFVDSSVRVPMEYVKNQEIVLNVGFEATSALHLGNETIGFKARFGGVARDILVPVDHVIAIYARENGQGMAFPLPTQAGEEDDEATSPEGDEAAAEPAAPVGLRLATPATAEDEGGGEGEARGHDEPPPAGPGGPARPALKRVK